MNICFITEEWPGKNDYGGIGPHFQNLASYLATKNYKITVIYNGEDGQEVVNGVKIIGARFILRSKRSKYTLAVVRKIFSCFGDELASVIEWNLLALFTFFALHKKHRFDIVETHEYHSTPILLLLKRYAKLVVSLHGGKKLTAQLNNDWGSFETKLLHFFELLFVRNVSWQYANSYATAEKSNAHFGTKVDEYIYNPIDTQFFVAGKNKGNQHNPYILFAGRFEKRKGVDLLLKAYREVARQLAIANIPQLYFVGKDTNQFIYKGKKVFFTELIRQTVDSSLCNKIKVFPYQKKPQLRKFYQNSLFCVFPSLYEPSGNVVYEAMSCGKAVITTRKGGPSEAIKHGHDGILIEPNIEPIQQALETLLNKPYLRKKLEQNARKKVEKFCSRKVIGEKTLSYYRELVFKKY